VADTSSIPIPIECASGATSANVEAICAAVTLPSWTARANWSVATAAPFVLRL
jgi:hypothetical protein